MVISGQMERLRFRYQVTYRWGGRLVLPEFGLLDSGRSSENQISPHSLFAVMLALG